jgi:hypothetical protein
VKQTDGMALIYGLFNEHRVCRYIGTTLFSRQRQLVWRRIFPNLKFATFLFVPAMDRTAIEGILIQEFKAYGQCDLNTCTNERSVTAIK